MENLITIEYLGTYAGAIVVVTLLTQFLKSLLPKINTRLICWAIAIIVEIGLGIITRVDAAGYFLAFLNSISIAVGAMGAYQLTLEKLDKKKATPTSTE